MSENQENAKEEVSLEDVAQAQAKDLVELCNLTQEVLSLASFQVSGLNKLNELVLLTNHILDIYTEKK